MSKPKAAKEELVRHLMEIKRTLPSRAPRYTFDDYERCSEQLVAAIVALKDGETLSADQLQEAVGFIYDSITQVNDDRVASAWIIHKANNQRGLSKKKPFPSGGSPYSMGNLFTLCVAYNLLRMKSSCD